MKDVQQKTLTAGEATAFDMRLKRSQFLVKNFTDGNIRVTLGDNDSYSMIAANSFELVFNNIDNKVSASAEATNVVTVTAEKAGLVEVSSIDF
jgi:hypothetical protein